MFPLECFIHSEYTYMYLHYMCVHLFVKMYSHVYSVLLSLDSAHLSLSLPHPFLRS